MSQLSGEELASHSIRANHELIVDLGRAKLALEQVTQESPDVFGLVTSEGRIIRGNAACAELLNCDDEQVYAKEFNALFRDETWRTVRNRLVLMGANSEKSTNFEMPIDKIDPDRLFHWTFSPFAAISDRRGKVYSFVGKDVTALRNYERKLATIFAALPLGVVTIDRAGVLEWPWSQFSQTILMNKDLTGASAKSVIFGRSMHLMTKAQIEGANLFFDNLGGDELWYEMAKGQFPTEVPVAASADSTDVIAWMGMTYNPIVRGGVVEKALVVIDDITERVKLREQITQKASKEQRIAQTLVELQDANPLLLATCTEDIDLYLDEISKLERANGSSRAICNSLHGVKGVARAVNLISFKELIHQTETKILQKVDSESGPLKDGMRADLHRINLEWNELKPFIDAFRSRTLPSADGETFADAAAKQRSELQQLVDSLTDRAPDAVRSDVAQIALKLREMFQVKFASVETKIAAFFAQTRRKLGRKADLQFEWNNAVVDRDHSAIACEIFYHLLTNALDHGIEPPDQRTASGKSPEGTIKITARTDGNWVHFSVQDDGKGFDAEKLVKKALERGAVKPGQQLTEKEKWHLALLSEMSTAEAVTDTSGRGIGLAAVDERVKKLGGAGLIIADSVRGKGTRFEFSIKN